MKPISDHSLKHSERREAINCFRSRVPLCLAGILLLLITPLFSLKAHGGDRQVTEEELKAAFVLNFLKFIEWPTLGGTEDPIRIGVYGTSKDFAAELKKLQNRRVRTHRLNIVFLEELPDLETLDSLEVLILNPKEEAEKRWLKELMPEELLIIGEQKPVAEEGGMIDFFMQRDRVRFRINHDNMKDAKLVVSSKLLRLATLVKEETP